MACIFSIKKILCGYFIYLFVLSHVANAKAHLTNLFSDEREIIPNISWLFSDHISKLTNRVKRSPLSQQNDNLLDRMNLKCRKDLDRLCNKIDNDELSWLECIQTFKPSEVSKIHKSCQEEFWKFVLNITDNKPIERLARNNCEKELKILNCNANDEKHGSYLSCLIDKRDVVKNSQCIIFIQRLERIAFSDFRIITPFMSDCKNDIDRFECNKLQPYRDISQGQILACLQENVEKLEPLCKRHILHVSEMQSDSIMLDRQLDIACTDDYIKFCRDERPGSGQIYKCLMQHKTDRAMSGKCQKQLERREKLISSDYKISKGLAKACKEDIRNNHCRKAVSDDKDIRLAQILLCLENAEKNGTKIDVDCQTEMFDHRKMLMEDYRLSPEIVDSCATDIKNFCNMMEYDGKTIHCLMEHTRPRKRKSRIAPKCQRALEDLLKEADVGEDWRIDPILREACQPVVDQACRDVRGGDARVISCLMEQLTSDRMKPACETALIQIQYFIARDYKLDPQLYRACKSDAVRLCHAKYAWYSDGMQMDPERGPLVLPCLYSHAYHPEKNMTLKVECLEEIRRVMRQRAINVDLLPEIEEECLNELAAFCYDKTAKGEEILCLQDHLENLNKKCKATVGNFTEEQAERVELNPILSMACHHTMERYCGDILKYGKDEGDMMECLIEHKNDIDIRSESKCKAVVEHFQLISLKNYHFTYKFKEACRSSVKRSCPGSKTKTEVIECLSAIMQEDIMKDTQHRIPKDCRQQIRAQLYQQRENIKLDPILKDKCAQDITKFCTNVDLGNSQVHECLASHKSKLSSSCHKQIFKMRRQEFQDSSSDYVLLNTCRAMVHLFCHDIPQSQALSCLKRYKDENSFDENCKNIVIKRMIEQNTDYRFNTALKMACSLDMNKHCKEVLKTEPEDKELEGKVIQCLKNNFREAKLTAKCQRQMVNILKEVALNYRLNPLLAAMCAYEIKVICNADESDPVAVGECLKKEFNAGNKDMKEECRIEIAELIQLAKADINVDPLLQEACATDVKKFCSSVPQGGGRHITCLQNVLQDTTKSLQPDCYKMLTTRIEMFRNAAKITGPLSLKELYTTVNQSPARRYFIIVALSMIGLIFIFGMFCGKVTRRTMMMKNK
ncbi:Golgi apparatus protein 1 [Prorops nasuta]|uniref:Golgi apparatus protein 1 n=1 Tax=Prorops nasuta TaxID=863751 RepID=UPI0034CE3858